MAVSNSENPRAILVGQLPPTAPVLLSKTLDAVARVNFEKDTFHYVQTNRRAWIISNAVFAGLCIMIATIWLYREWSWSQERVQLRRQIYENMIEAARSSARPS